MKAQKSMAKGGKAEKSGSKIASLKKAILDFHKKKPAAKAGAKAAPAAPEKAAAKKAPLKNVETKPAKAAAPAKAVPPKAEPMIKAAAGKGPKGKGPKGGKNSGMEYAMELASRTSLRESKDAKDANGEAVCREVACEGLATTGGYCRLHYIKNWKKIKRKELILKEKKLNQYIEELVAKYPDKYIEAIRQDLASDKDFAKVIYDLDLDESVDDFDVEGESVDAVLDTIKRDFEDEGEGF